MVFGHLCQNAYVFISKFNPPSPSGSAAAISDDHADADDHAHIDRACADDHAGIPKNGRLRKSFKNHPGIIPYVDKILHHPGAAAPGPPRGEGG